MIQLGELNIMAQEIAVSTGNPQLDALRIRIWLSTDEHRLPLRFTLGGYQFDLKLAQPVSEP
jgi:hypothetical protein